jgi:hypothetical protein
VEPDITAALFAPLFASMTVAAGLIFMAGWLACKPLHATWLIIALMLLDSSQISLAFQYGLWIYPEDLFFCILFLASLVRLTLFVPLKTVPGAWWLIGSIQLFLAVIGFKSFGSAAGVDFRGHFYLWITVTYFCSVDWSDAMLRRFANAWVCCATVLCLMIYYRWTMSAIDPAYAAEMMALDITGVRFRVVGSSAALTIAVAFLILMFRMLCGRLTGLSRALPGLYFITVLVLQHRSVWVSLIAGYLCLMWTQRKQAAGKRALRAIGMLLLPLALLFLLSGSQNAVLDSVRTSANQAISLEEGTMVGRVVNWQELLVKWVNSKNPMTYILGNAYGSGYNPVESQDGENIYDMVPHNHLVHMLYRGGLVGVCCTLSVFIRLGCAGVAAVKRKDKYWAPFFVAVFAAIFAYYIPYWAMYSTGMLLGIAVSYFDLQKTRARVCPALDSGPAQTAMARA